MAKRHIEWRFNPPNEFSFGGVWKRLVRSSKKAIYIVMGKQKITEDVLTTTVCIVEGIVNQRHLTSVSDDIDSYVAITPKHFLIESSESEMFRMYSKKYERHRKLKKMLFRSGAGLKKRHPDAFGKKQMVQKSENTIPRR